mmetsp:Transcript_33529/g.47632  ORF Transcript_33529/g.47632 Transcript_33529/m.47632 type:complete len:111 (-) Transcript_33529:990-1322(-)
MFFGGLPKNLGRSRAIGSDCARTEAKNPVETTDWTATAPICRRWIMLLRSRFLPPTKMKDARCHLFYEPNQAKPDFRYPSPYSVLILAVHILLSFRLDIKVFLVIVIIKV